MSDQPPNVVYGRLLEAAHISGYGFERMTDELEWLLDGDRWQQVGPGYRDVNEFLRSIDLSAFNLSEKKRLHRRIKELQPTASTYAIGSATGTPQRTVVDHINGERIRSPHVPDQDESGSGERIRSPFEHDSKAVADAARQATNREQAHADREESRAANRALTLGVEPPRGPATTIVMDPPWDWSDEGDVDHFGRGKPRYHTMSLDEIAAQSLPLGARDDAHLYLWITNRSLPKGFGLLEEWGFRYVTCLTWVKPHYGLGNYYRGQTEHVLFGVRGSLPLLRNDVGTVLHADRAGEHSTKPDEFYELVETCSPGPWMEMYARRRRPGWLEPWGADAPKEADG